MGSQPEPVAYESVIAVVTGDIVSLSVPVTIVTGDPAPMVIMAMMVVITAFMDDHDGAGIGCGWR